MFVGRCSSQPSGNLPFLKKFEGSILGDLGRHSTIGPDGWPVVNERTVVFEKVMFNPLFRIRTAGN